MRNFVGALLLSTALAAPVALAQAPQQCVTNAVAGGTADAITIPLLPCGLATNILILTITANNTTTTPTLQMAGFPAQRIYTNTLANPGVGDFGNAGSVLMLTSTGTSWLIINGNVGGFIPLPLDVADGGTGVATIASHGLVYGNGTSPIGVVAAGTTGQYLKGSTGAAPTWGTLGSDTVTTWSAGSTGLTPSSPTSGAVVLAGTLGVPNGGTGDTTLASNGVLYGNGASAIQAVAAGTTGQILIGTTSSAPSWLTAGTTGQYLKATTGSAPSWGTLASDTVSTISFGTTGLTPNSATAGAVTVAGTLGFANGGTSNTSYTNGQLLIGNTGTGGLSKSTLTAGTNVTITNSAGGITIASTGLASGCGTNPNPSGYVLTSDGSGACTSNSDATFVTGTLSLGVNTSEAGVLKLFGGTSGSGSIKFAAVAGTGSVLTLPGGTTDFSATGGTNQVVKQASAGAALTVGTIACAGLSDAGTACTAATGTSGHTLPFLDGANTWSGVQTFTNSDIVLLGSSTGKTTFTSANAGASNYTLTIPAATDTIAELGQTQTFTGVNSFAGTSSNLAASLVNAKEPATISATSATGTINYDVCTQSVVYYTSNAGANWTTNFRCSSGTSLNTAMATGDVVTVVFLVTQGGSPFYNNAVQVDGGAVTPKYQGGTAWNAGNASSVDAYTYAITKTANATFTVFASQTQFK